MAALTDVGAGIASGAAAAAAMAGADVAPSPPAGSAWRTKAVPRIRQRRKGMATMEKKPSCEARRCAKARGVWERSSARPASWARAQQKGRERARTHTAAHHSLDVMCSGWERARLWAFYYAGLRFELMSRGRGGEGVQDGGIDSGQVHWNGGGEMG